MVSLTRFSMAAISNFNGYNVEPGNGPIMAADCLV